MGTLLASILRGGHTREHTPKFGSLVLPRRRARPSDLACLLAPFFVSGFGFQDDINLNVSSVEG
jgi:hypothetical protein